VELQNNERRFGTSFENRMKTRRDKKLAIEVKRKKMRKKRPDEGVMWPF
jgi:hypothetical protein